MLDQLRTYRLYLLMVALNLVVLAGVIYLLRRPEPRVLVITTPAPHATATPALIQVQVSGAIARPGLYKLPADARVTDALDTAGGARPEANLEQLNLARKLNDGELVRVPTRAPTAKAATPLPNASGQTPASTVLARINLNEATVEQLDTLPHIGPALAQRIVDYRLQNGPFQSVEDIKDVKGIGDSIFNDLKDLITTGTNGD